MIRSASRYSCVATLERDVKLGYDKLLIATGARPVQPPIEGLNLAGVFPLHTMENSFAVHRFLEERQPKSAIIVGAGYIGLEMADALTHRGIHVTLASRTEAVLATVDTVFGKIVETELQKHGVEVWNKVEVDAIRADGVRGLTVTGSQGFSSTAELVLVAVGVVPNSELGVAAGIATGAKGALCVNRRMETEVPGHLCSRRLRGDLASSFEQIHLHASWDNSP